MPDQLQLPNTSAVNFLEWYIDSCGRELIEEQMYY